MSTCGFGDERVFERVQLGEVFDEEVVELNEIGAVVEARARSVRNEHV